MKDRMKNRKTQILKFIEICEMRGKDLERIIYPPMFSFWNTVAINAKKLNKFAKFRRIQDGSQKLQGSLFRVQIDCSEEVDAGSWYQGST